MLKNIFLIFLILSSFSESVFAESFQGKFASWSVFTIDFKNKEKCYIMSLPIKKEGNYKKRGEPYFLIINSFDDIDEVNISSGYIFKEGSQSEISFGSIKFNTLTYKGLSWANNKNDDLSIIREMKSNLDFVVRGLNKNNQYSEDTYSLVGFNQAFEKMKTICHNNSDDKNDKN